MRAPRGPVSLPRKYDFVVQETSDIRGGVSCVRYMYSQLQSGSSAEMLRRVFFYYKNLQLKSFLSYVSANILLAGLENVQTHQPTVQFCSQKLRLQMSYG